MNFNPEKWKELLEKTADKAKPIVEKHNYAKQAESALNDYLNRKPFEFDVNADKLYQKYKSNAAESGRLAMEDAMARASSMTGGYANSFAQNVGQQAYQIQLDAADQMIPELYQLAKDKYDSENQAMLNKYSIYSGLANAQKQTPTTQEESPWKGLSPSEASDFVATYQSLAYDPEALQMFLATQNIPDDILYALKYGNSSSEDGESDPILFRFRDLDPWADTGWEMKYNGGAKSGDLNDDAEVRAPDGKVYTIEELFDKLVEEGMTEAEAEKFLISLQRNVGITES